MPTDPDKAVKHFGDYVLFERIGSGAIGDTFVAQSRHGEHAGELVCLKILGRQHQAASEERRRDAVQALRHEADVVSRLEHPNIARLLDRGSYNDVWFLAFELIQGANLAEVLAMHEPGRGLGPEQVRRIGIEVAAALECAHDHDVLHRDLKLHNVLVSRDGAVKLVDFGVAKANARLTQDFTVGVGTPRYWAPEQRQNAALTPATDIYGLGLVLFELLTGQHPFDGNDPNALARNALLGNIQHDLRIGAAPEDLVTCIERCLRTDPKERFQAASELRAVLVAGGSASGFAYQIGQLVGDAREFLDQHGAFASSGALDESAAASNGTSEADHAAPIADATTVVAERHRVVTRFAETEELASTVRDSIPRAMTSDVRDEVLRDLSRMARLAVERRSHTGRRAKDNDAPTRNVRKASPPNAQFASSDQPMTARGRRSKATVMEFTAPSAAPPSSVAHSEAKERIVALAPVEPPVSSPEPTALVPVSVTTHDTAHSGAARRRIAVWPAVVLLAVIALALLRTFKGTIHPTPTAAISVAAKVAHKAAPHMQPTEPPRLTQPTPTAVVAASPTPEAGLAQVEPASPPKRITKITQPVHPPRGANTAPLVAVSIGVIPYGDLAVDGKKLGPGPLTVKLPVGGHRFTGTFKAMHVSRAVVVSADMEPVILDLRHATTSISP